ncbi:hypothetical protein CLAIMM_01698 [Cladophialophora immunda]|nr:hypothetical protein CLAIMM_01698 [Cladophialophora immunda]
MCCDLPEFLCHDPPKPAFRGTSLTKQVVLRSYAAPAMISEKSSECPGSDGIQTAATVDTNVYSVFTGPSRRAVTVLLGFATLTSPLTATIYLPLLPLLSTHFDVSPQKINLTITIFIIFQALSPLIVSTFADTCGRRPLFLASFTIYTLASLGLALNPSSYAALLVLRALQSLGSSAVLSICYGVVSDICMPSERGEMLGPVLAAANLGTAIGPIVGGWIARSSGSVWWAFWALVIFGALMVLTLGLFLPETARTVVGSGSVEDQVWNRPLIDLTKPVGLRPGQSNEQPTRPPTRSVKFRSPLMSIRIMAYPDTALVLWLVGTFYALWYTVQASIPYTYGRHPYNFNELQIGLAYLPGSAGVIFCMYITGKAMDHNHRLVARQAGLVVDKAKAEDLVGFRSSGREVEGVSGSCSRV